MRLFVDCSPFHRAALDNFGKIGLILLMEIIVWFSRIRAFSLDKPVIEAISLH